MYGVIQKFVTVLLQFPAITLLIAEGVHVGGITQTTLMDTYK